MAKVDFEFSRAFSCFVDDRKTIKRSWPKGWRGFVSEAVAKEAIKRKAGRRIKAAKSVEGE